MKISAVINTYNEEKNIGRCLESIVGFADEIILIDMHSTDRTVAMARKFRAKVFFYEHTRYVEPARNFALSKAKSDWVLVIDADEVLPSSLKDKLKQITTTDDIDYVEIPRKNIIFNKWISHSRWWPDYLIRFFKKGKVKYSDKIHFPPSAEGEGVKLPEKEENALVHYNFQSISQFIERLDRYSDIQAEELEESGYVFNWQDVLRKPAGEFFSRFFSGEGFKDGLHGLALALLQAFSELAIYLKVWEKRGFEENEVKNVNQILEKVLNDHLFWLQKMASDNFGKFRLKLKSKF